MIKVKEEDENRDDSKNKNLNWSFVYLSLDYFFCPGKIKVSSLGKGELFAKQQNRKR